jgi:hypothetical protein
VSTRIAVLEMTYQLLFLGSPLLLTAIVHGLCIKYGWLSWLKRPLDLGLSFRRRRIFGDHKTWRGLVINAVFCTMGTMIQTLFQNRGYFPPWLLLLDYREYGYVIGILLGLGMTLGELPNSFVKRQLEIPPGKKKKVPHTNLWVNTGMGSLPRPWYMASAKVSEQRYPYAL